jgi:hypothetical protein
MALHRADPVVLQSVLTCPRCGHAKQETMPTDACQFFYECEGCKTLLRPLPGDCCVYCSFGTVKCPPMQEHPGCCPADRSVLDPDDASGRVPAPMGSPSPK